MLPRVYGKALILPLVEAQACGKPVVAFDVGAHSEVVSTPEKRVYWFPRQMCPLWRGRSQDNSKAGPACS